MYNIIWWKYDVRVISNEINILTKIFEYYIFKAYKLRYVNPKLNYNYIINLIVIVHIAT